MRLTNIFAKDIAPLNLVRIDDLSNTVVVAGRNGIGKTRFVQALLQHVINPQVAPNFRIRIQATTIEEENAWGKKELDTGVPHDVQVLRTTIQRNRRRNHYSSSFLNFESNRTIQQVNQFGWDWNFNDPFEEEVGWNFGMQNMTARFNDLVHSIFRKLRSNREAIALHYEQLLKARESLDAAKDVPEAERLKRPAEPIEIDPSKFPDVLEPFKSAFSQLLSPKQLVDPQMQSQQLSYRTENGTVLPVTALSSGEREVVNIAFDFLLRSPTDSVIIFDEPELHLHPELSYRLLQTLRRIGARNQFIFCTHSAEIITASLDNTVVFLAPPKGSEFNQALVVKEDDATHQALKLMGQSIGIVALGKKIVLIEGEQGSLDKQTYGAILRDKFPKLALVPSGGKSLLQSFSTLNEQVLSNTIWGVDFFMLCDRDALPLADPRELEKLAAGHLRMLKRYHLENYFLDEITIAKLFERLVQPDSWLRSPERIRAKLKEISREQGSYATALTASAFFRERVGNISLMPKACNGKTVEELRSLILSRSNQEKERIEKALTDGEIAIKIDEIARAIKDSLDNDTDDWKALIPGKIIVKSFCSHAPIAYDQFQTAYINAAREVENDPFSEIVEIFASFDQVIRE